MAYDTYVVSAPGSLMLFGEHAVLHGKNAIACAINKHISVTLKPRRDDVINIASALGNFTTTIKDLAVTQPFEFVLTSILQEKQRLKFGFDLSITANFPADMGLGSSAAVTVATCGALHYWLYNKMPELTALQQQAKHIIQLVQGIGSGADAAASIFGGIIAYTSEPIQIKQLATELPLTVVYSGSKLATRKVIDLVKSTQDKYPDVFSMLYNTIDICTLQAIEAIKTKNWQKLGELANIHQGLQDALGVNNNTLSAIIFALRTQPTIYGAKISGSGLGDCVIGIGSTHNKLLSKLDIDIEPTGIQFTIK